MAVRDFPSTDGIARLKKAEARELADALRAEVRRHDHLYYVEDHPEISDEAYDRLYEALLALVERFPELASPDSPTLRVGAEPLDAFPTVRHTAPMALGIETLDEAAFLALVRDAGAEV